MSEDIQTYESGNVKLRKGYIVGKRWVVIRPLGEGGCGSVYRVIDKITNERLAMKAESNCISGGSVLKLEAQIMRKLVGKPQFPQIRWSGKREHFSYIVMTLLGAPLADLLVLHGKCRSSISTQVRVGLQLLHALKSLHDVGVVHRDIKPANLAMGHPENPDTCHVLHILDFGLAREYMWKTDGRWEFRRKRTDCLFRGTSRYCSINTHQKGDQGRVDDLWGLVYMIVEMRRTLPWSRAKEKHEIELIKINTPDSELFLKSPPKLARITTHLRTLGYYDRPDYGLIYRVFMEIIEDEKIESDELYDWEEYKPDQQRLHRKPSKHNVTATPGELKEITAQDDSRRQSNSPIDPANQSPVADEKNEEEVNVSDTQEDPIIYGFFPAEDFLSNPTGL